MDKDVLYTCSASVPVYFQTIQHRSCWRNPILKVSKSNPCLMLTHAHSSIAHIEHQKVSAKWQVSESCKALEQNRGLQRTQGHMKSLAKTEWALKQGVWLEALLALKGFILLHSVVDKLGTLVNQDGDRKSIRPGKKGISSLMAINLTHLPIVTGLMGKSCPYPSMAPNEITPHPSNNNFYLFYFICMSLFYLWAQTQLHQQFQSQKFNLTFRYSSVFAIFFTYAGSRCTYLCRYTYVSSTSWAAVLVLLVVVKVVSYGTHSRAQEEVHFLCTWKSPPVCLETLIGVCHAVFSLPVWKYLVMT